MENATFWKEFFLIYKDLPALWRVKSSEYSDRVLKAKCYMKLIRKLKEIHPDADREMVVKKINNFRTSFRKELRRMRECRKMGKVHKPTLWYFDYLRFLDDQDDGWSEKSTNDMDNIEEIKQGSRDAVVVKAQVAAEPMTATKRMGDFKDSEEECLPNPSQKRKLTHFHKKPMKKPSFAEQQEAKIDAEILANSWAVQYKGMKEDQKLIARKLISDILFYGCLGTLTTNSVIDLQEVFLKESTNPLQHFNLQPQSPIESNSSFQYAEQEFFNNGSMRESPIEYNSTSPPMSPTTNSVVDIPARDIKFEVP